MWIGIALFIIGITIFLWNDSHLDISSSIKSEKFGQFGDFIGGLIGSLWAFSGVILFYVALNEQRKDIKINREALKQQISEFELQRVELEETRKIFEQQHETQVYQRFENTFFQLLHNHNEIVNSLDLRAIKSHKLTNTGRDCFKSFYLNFSTELKDIETSNKREAEVINSYIETYNKYEADLSHYFRNLYNIIKFIDNSEIKNKKIYTNFVRAQLSNYELIFLFYNCLSKNGIDKFKPLVEKYSLLKNINKSQLFEGHVFISKYKEKTFK
ncbi:putative phage abortive infection protein [Sunxiuqinia elliptica]|uniref:Putative phage abortive infection protein n=2 Tax=Sunxiuqinia elliptica TaxID=655355 RepID=A0A4R6GR39_9BACT|nr:putative phage abortive infection protein [Sunxiuqinia elliptica]TDO55900.1 putative phage abortive infection protein [Sunxiuqinia elliptica]